MPPAFLARVITGLYVGLNRIKTWIVPPELRLIEMGVASWTSMSLHAVATLRIADRLAAGPRSAEQLAAELGLHAPSLYRVLRALSMQGVFRQDRQRRFSLTRLGQKLRSDVPGSARAQLEFFGASWQMAAWQELLYTIRTGKPAFDQVHGQPFFDFCAGNPEAARVFDGAMVGIVQLHAGAMLSAYDFSGLRSLVDVGGGHGLLLGATLRRYPALQGVLFDLPHVLEAAGPQLEAFGVAQRCSRQGGSFFDAVPAGHDAYLMSHILHDWDDEGCLRILRVCRAAMRPDSRLLVVDALLPPGDEFHPAKLSDLQMMVTLTGKERTEAEFRDLFAAAGLRLARVVPTAASESVLEALVA